MAILTDFHIKRGDTADMIAFQLEYPDGSPITSDITGAIPRFSMKTAPPAGNPGGGTVIIDRGVGIWVDPARKAVGYPWQPGDTELVTTDGQANPATAHRLECEVTFADGSVQTFPNSPPPGSDVPFIRVHVYRDIRPA